jgi:transposase-like protein
MQKSNNSGRKGISGGRSPHAVSFMIQVANYYAEHDESLAQVAERFNISLPLAAKWHRRFNLHRSEQSHSVAIMTEQEQKQYDALKKQNEELAKQLAYANLQVFGLQTMIEVAEKELKIDIRKKPGTKQSDK